MGALFTGSLAKEPNGLDPSAIFTLDKMIGKLREHVDAATLDGLNIAKVFRNKEAHVVTVGHRFEPLEYAAIEHAVVAVYKVGFDETLDFSIGIKKGTKSAFQISNVSV